MLIKCGGGKGNAKLEWTQGQGQVRGSNLVGCFRCSEMVRCSSSLDCERRERERRAVGRKFTFHKEDKVLLSKKNRQWVCVMFD